VAALARALPRPYRGADRSLEAGRLPSLWRTRSSSLGTTTGTLERECRPERRAARVVHRLTPPRTLASSCAPPLPLLAVAEIVPDDDVRLRDGRQSCASRNDRRVSTKSARRRCWRLPYGCWPRNLMSIRRGSQRRLGRPSAVIAGATVTDSTVSPITSSSAVVSFSKVSWLAGRPNKPSSPSCRIVSSRSALARSIASSASRICYLRDAGPCAAAVAEYARTASSTSSSTRSALTAARRRHRSALVSPQR